MRKLGVFVVLLVFLSASQVMAAPNLTGMWQGDGVLATPENLETGQMDITIDNQQEAPGGAVFRGTWNLSTEGNPNPVYGDLTGTISPTNGIHMTVSDGEAIAVLSGKYLGTAINVVLQDLTDQGVTGAFSLKLAKPEQIPDDGQEEEEDQSPAPDDGQEEEEDRPAESAPAQAPAQQPAPAAQR